MHKLTIKDGNSQKEMTIEFDKDGDINDMITVFRTVAIFLTYGTDTVNEHLLYNDDL